MKLGFWKGWGKPFSIGGGVSGTGDFISWLLKDDFLDTRPAGSVNGTAATPTGGTRTAVDTESKLSVGSGVLSFSGGKATPAYGDPRISYLAVTRAAGVTGICKITPPATNKDIRFGFSTDVTSAAPNLDAMLHLTSGALISDRSTGVAVSLGAYTATTYTFALVLRGTGVFYFVKGGVFTNWTLLYPTKTNNTASLRFLVSNFNAAPSMDFIRIPSNLIAITPLASDAFTRADGAIGSTGGGGSEEAGGSGLAWTGSTYTISTNKAINTPTQGSEIVTNGNMETGDPPSSWTASNATLTSVVDERTGGAGTKSINVVPTAAFGRATQVITAAAGTWLAINYWTRRQSGTGLHFGHMGVDLPYSSSATWVNVICRFRCTAANPTFSLIGQTIGEDYRFDDVSIKALTTSTLLSSLQGGTANVMAEVAVTVATGQTQAGLVLNLDSASNPQNFILCYHDLSYVYLDECVNGTYTNKIKTAATYSAGARLIVRRSGTACRVYYNDALVGTEQTMTANTNTLHGLFSTYSGNTLDNFVLWNEGSGGEYEGKFNAYAG